MGGQLSLYAACANAKVGACVDFYEINPNVTPDLTSLQAPVLSFFAENDEMGSRPRWRARSSATSRPPANRPRSRSSRVPTTPFSTDTRREVYHESYANQYWERMTTFFERHLRDDTS